MTRRGVPWLDVMLAALLLASVALAVLSRKGAFPTAATSIPVVVSMVVCAIAVLVARARLGAGWLTMRRALAWVAAGAVAYPGLWGTAALVSTAAPGSRAAWLTAVLAGTAHLPLLAAFSIVPLLALRYLDGGLARWPAVAIGGLAGLSMVSIALFITDLAPFAADPLVVWAPGETFARVVSLAFLASVLVGPLVSLLHAWRAETEAARRLALVAASALAGAALVMLCGTAVLMGEAGYAVVLAGMYAALALACVGTVRALSTPLLPATAGAPSHAHGDPSGARRSSGGDDTDRLRTSSPTPLTPREAEVLSLLAAGLSNAGIAARLVLSERTVDAHLRSVFTKLDLPDGPQQNRRVHAALRWAHVRGSEVDAGDVRAG